MFTLITTCKLMHSHIPHSSDEGWVYFFPCVLPQQMHLIRLSLHSTLKSPRCVIGNVKLDGWALKASAVVKCQSPGEPRAK